MSSNQLKTIACIAMLADHIGYLLFPEVIILRYIGRLAMPLFSYFIAEGCRYTRSRKRYLFNILSLAVLCQLFYLAEAIINGGITEIYLNVLFTFGLSILVCSAFLRLKASFEQITHHRIYLNILLFIITIFVAVYCCTKRQIFGIPLEFDYGFAGVFLPLFAVVFPDKERQLPLFTIGIIIYNLLILQELPYIWFSLFTVPLILFYNGLRGKLRLKAAFYLFYPLHFALIYGIKLFFLRG